jgi:hypothetical protein
MLSWPRTTACARTEIVGVLVSFKFMSVSDIHYAATDVLLPNVGAS